MQSKSKNLPRPLRERDKRSLRVRGCLACHKLGKIMYNKKSAVTIGAFDGVHKGHRFLISETVKAAKMNGLKSVIVVLERPVKKVHGVLSLYDEKIEEIKRCGADEIIVIPVPSAALSEGPDEFFENFLMRGLRMSELICGADFAFGKDRKGDIKWLRKKSGKSGVGLKIVKPLKAFSHKISSSNIRSLILNGDVKNAAKLLGRNYSFSGMPFKDRGVGTKMGFPTVNLNVDKAKLLPKGIYASLISDSKRIYPSVTSIGTRPTFSGTGAVIPETHILGFHGKWSKSKTKVILLEKIRDEKKFETIDALKKQIRSDVIKAEKIFKGR